MKIKHPFFYLIIYPNVRVDKGCKKWDLSIFYGVCSGCKKKIKVNIPFVSHDIRGLIGIFPCQHCGGVNVPFTFVATGERAPFGIYLI